MSENMATVEDLLAGDELGQEEVTLPNGKVVVVKGLTSFERQLTLKNTIKDGFVDTATIEIRMLQYGLVNPKMSYQQVEQWVKKASIGAVKRVSDKIRELSAMGDDAEKSDV